MESFEFVDSSQCRTYLDALSGRNGRPSMRSWPAVAESPLDGRAPAPVTPRCRPLGGPFDALRSPSLVMPAAGDNVAGVVSVHVHACVSVFAVAVRPVWAALSGAARPPACMSPALSAREGSHGTWWMLGRPAAASLCIVLYCTRDKNLYLYL